MEIKCKKCRALLPHASIDWDREIATCEKCDQLQTVAHLKKYMIEKPSGIDESRDGDRLYFRVRKMPVVGGAILLMSVLATVVLVILFFNKDQQTSFSLQMGVIAVILGLFSVSTLFFMNQVVLALDEEMLRVTNTLIPGFAKTYRLAEIDQFVVDEVELRHKDHSPFGGDLFGPSTRSVFTISFLKVSYKIGKRKTVVGWLSYEQALYLEREIEKFFAIEDWDFYNPSSSVLLG